MTSVIATDQLKQYISRIERLETEKANAADDIKQVYDEAKANGFDIKIMKKVLRRMKLDNNKVAEETAIFDLYCEALGIST